LRLCRANFSKKRTEKKALSWASFRARKSDGV